MLNKASAKTFSKIAIHFIHKHQLHPCNIFFFDISPIILGPNLRISYHISRVSPRTIL